MLMTPPATALDPADPVFVLETDRNTWIALTGTDEAGIPTRFRLAFTTLEKARSFAASHPELPARRVRELCLADITSPEDPPVALDVDPAAL